MDAINWLKSIGKKLQVVQCNNREKVLLVSHELFDPVANWWDAYVEPMRNTRALTGRNSVLLSMHIMFPKE
jgi:hypothetical protein